MTQKKLFQINTQVKLRFGRRNGKMPPMVFSNFYSILCRNHYQNPFFLAELFLTFGKIQSQNLFLTTSTNLSQSLVSASLTFSWWKLIGFDYNSNKFKKFDWYCDFKIWKHILQKYVIFNENNETLRKIFLLIFTIYDYSKNLKKTICFFALNLCDRFSGTFYVSQHS